MTVGKLCGATLLAAIALTCPPLAVQVRFSPTGEIMVLKLNKRASSVKSLREVELLKKLRHPNVLQ